MTNRHTNTEHSHTTHTNTQHSQTAQDTLPNRSLKITHYNATRFAQNALTPLSRIFRTHFDKTHPVIEKSLTNPLTLFSEIWIFGTHFDKTHPVIENRSQNRSHCFQKFGFSVNHPTGGYPLLYWGYPLPYWGVPPIHLLGVGTGGRVDISLYWEVHPGPDYPT